MNNYLEVNYAKEVNLKDLKLKDSKNSRDVYSDEDRGRFMAVFRLNQSDPCNVLAVLFCTGMRSGDDHVIIRLKLDKPSKYDGLS